MKTVFVTGATGYMGQRLIPALTARGHRVLALVREGSQSKSPPGCEIVTGDALNAATYFAAVPKDSTLAHLVGVAHPGPGKAQQFRDIDLKSALAAVTAAQQAGVAHFVYLSVAQPAPVMKAYLAVRAEGEAAIRATGIPATFLRPWYVLGPGHWWPYAFVPFYWLASLIPPWCAGAQRLGLVTIDQMVRALVQAVEDPPPDARIVDVPGIRAAAPR